MLYVADSIDHKSILLYNNNNMLYVADSIDHKSILLFNNNNNMLYVADCIDNKSILLYNNNMFMSLTVLIASLYCYTIIIICFMSLTVLITSPYCYNNTEIYLTLCMLSYQISCLRVNYSKAESKLTKIN